MKSPGILLGISPLFFYENSGLVDQSKCGDELQCYQLPTGCDYASSTDGCTLVSWEADTNGINFAITHKAADAASYWAAFALANNPAQMADGDAYTSETEIEKNERMSWEPFRYLEVLHDLDFFCPVHCFVYSDLGT